MKTIVLSMILVSVFKMAFTLDMAVVYSQQVDPRERGMSFYARAKQLKDNIQKGWGPSDVVTIMGQPEERRTSSRGNDSIEVWGYSGFDVRIVFENGLVSDWTFRLMR